MQYHSGFFRSYSYNFSAVFRKRRSSKEFQWRTVKPAHRYRPQSFPSCDRMVEPQVYALVECGSLRLSYRRRASAFLSL